MRRLAALLCTCVLALAAAMPASAHKESDAYLTLSVDRSNGHVLHGQWDIALRDLDFAVGLDSNHDGAITWGEVKAHRTTIEHYALARLSLHGDGLACSMQPRAQKVDRHTDGVYAVIYFDAVCDTNIPTTLTVDYRLMADLDPYHRGIVTLRNGAATAGAVLGPDRPSASLSLRQPSRWRQFKSFVNDGIWHIWTGFDHMLFLLSLLFPAVLVRRRALRDAAGTAAAGAMSEAGGTLSSTLLSAWRWVPAEGFWSVMLEVIKVVTAFTVSHSVTLSLAVLGIVALPSWLVESGIALSVAVAAFNNIHPIVRHRVWLIAFIFGFIHGLGFASALAGLDLPAGAMAASLGGFNVGVEIGQEAIVLAFLPLAWLLRRTRFYRIGLLRWGSWLIVAVALAWFVQRAFGVTIPFFNALLPN